MNNSLIPHFSPLSASSSARRKTKNAVSYKEASEDDKTDSEDLIDAPELYAAPVEDEDDKAETIERILAKRLGRKGVTGNQTTVYAVEESGDPNADNPEEPLDRHNSEMQYLIKWKGWSHIHNTWESEASLAEQRVKGMKKMENYIKKERDIDAWRSYANIEDLDYFECQLELQQDLLKSYNDVDRIIAETERPDGGMDYLCKWESLPYSEATWEDSSLVLRKWEAKVAAFHRREESKNTPSMQSKALRYRPKFHPLKQQPEYQGDLVLRDYQMDGLNWLILTWCKENSVILADEMGLGKTIQTISFLYHLYKTQQLYGPFLCVVPLSTMTAWQREFALWAPEMNFVTYLGDVASREIIRQHEWQYETTKRLKFNALLTTYEIVLKDKAVLGRISWASLLVDEAHRLKNEDSLLYKALKEFDTNHRLLITGTPLQNSLKELWALLHFIMPQNFGRWEEFQREHDTGEGGETNKDYTKLHRLLEPYILRRVKKDVEKSLPAKVEQILRVEMTSTQRQYYKWILTKNFNALRKGTKGSQGTFLNIMIELKKCCNHAMLIKPTEYEQQQRGSQDDAVNQLLRGSGKMVLLDKLLCRLRETGHRVLIFSQMVRMLDILAEYLQKRHFPFQRLDGTIKGEIRKQAMDHFNAEGSQDFCFLLSTRAGGLGINLATADTVIIFDSDWNPQNDLQAQARAHRIGQKNQVNIYRLVTARSVEEDIVERAKQKMVLDHLVIQRMDTTGRTVLDKRESSNNTTPFNKDELSAILKFGAEELFNKDENDNDDDLVCDIDEILRRAETRHDAPAMVGDELLSAFKVASFAAFDEENPAGNGEWIRIYYLKGIRLIILLLLLAATEGLNQEDDDHRDWEEIIPEQFRKQLDEEEKLRELGDMYLPPRRKTQAQQKGEVSAASGAGNSSRHHGHASSSSKEKSSSKKRKKAEVEPSDEDAPSEESENEERPKKRGRPSNKERLLNFTDAELRRFIKSYKKFPAPLKRLESIATDADLMEKPLHELRKLGELLRKRCVAFMADHKDIEPPANEAKKRGARAGFSVKFGGASFNAKTLWTCEEELRPLDEVVPSVREERARWQLEFKTRPANFDVEWGQREDTKLMVGIYQYGMGSWEAMKVDASLEFVDKILLHGETKPQAKHLQTRAEYLLKVIRKNLDLRKNGKKQRKPRKRKEKEKVVVVKEEYQSLDDISSSNDEKKTTTFSAITNHVGGGLGMTITAAARKEMVDPSALPPVAVEHHQSHNHHQNSNASMDENSKDGGAGGYNNNKEKLKKVKKEKKCTKRKNSEGPMHFTANNEPRALTVLGDLDPTVFNECKEKMRPVKKALKALDNPDQSLSPQEQVRHTTECLLSIGKQIDECLRVYGDAERVKEWRSNLWYFVSKFTEFDANKLFKLFKRALKKSMGGDEEDGDGRGCDGTEDGGAGGGVDCDGDFDEDHQYSRAGGSGSHNGGGGGGGGSDTDAKEMKSYNRKSSHYQEEMEKRSKHERRSIKLEDGEVEKDR